MEHLELVEHMIENKIYLLKTDASIKGNEVIRFLIKRKPDDTLVLESVLLRTEENDIFTIKKQNITERALNGDTGKITFSVQEDKSILVSIWSKLEGQNVKHNIFTDKVFRPVTKLDLSYPLIRDVLTDEELKKFLNDEEEPIE